MKCKVCNKEFELKKENKYIVNAKGTFLPPDKREAFNCPYCGCQNIVGLYFEPLFKDKKVSNNEKDKSMQVFAKINVNNL